MQDDPPTNLHAQDVCRWMGLSTVQQEAWIMEYLLGTATQGLYQDWANQADQDRASGD